ncbi:MAG: hypothetical protein AB1454_00085 [Candidatus Auribacterota bacterium]
MDFLSLDAKRLTKNQLSYARMSFCLAQLFFINIRTRKVHIAGITDHPSELWMVNRAKYMEEFFEDDTKKILIHDGDKKFPAKFDKIFEIHNTLVKKLPYKSPNLNPYAESWVSIIARECIDKFCTFGE